MLENVALDPESGAPDYADLSKTPNGRVSYPIDHIRTFHRPQAAGQGGRRGPAAAVVGEARDARDGGEAQGRQGQPSSAPSRADGGVGAAHGHRFGAGSVC